jgi:hypothetical protein
MNPKDKICVDVPLFIRLLEYAREDAKTDMDLHNVAENIIELSQLGETLGMQEYALIVSGGGLSEGFDLRKYLAENRLENGLDDPFNPTQKVTYELKGPLSGLTLTIEPDDSEYGQMDSTIEGGGHSADFVIYKDDDDISFNVLVVTTVNGNYDGWVEDVIPEVMLQLSKLGSISTDDDYDDYGEYAIKVKKDELSKFI